jgi:hypothetical protein
MVGVPVGVLVIIGDIVGDALTSSLDIIVRGPERANIPGINSKPAANNKTIFFNIIPPLFKEQLW